MKLDGRGVVITGASDGLGAAIARTCLAEGASILICARDAARLDRTAGELLKQAPGRVHAQPADTRDAAAMAKLIGWAEGNLPRFCGLVNNAGMWGPKGLLEDVAWEEWQYALEVNLFGVVHGCRFAVPHLRKHGYGKIVNLSGGGATSPMPHLSAYAASKAAVVRFTETLAGETRGDHIDVNALAPGAMNTAMLDEILKAGPERVGTYYQQALKQKESGGASLERAAAACVHLLSAETDGISGKLISAVWDPWETISVHGPELASTDIYALRRIVPEDRGLSWDKK
jgi:NAD(P)-dependent dehydrogenase (short-subunit alcohol dehydrogenase family)